MLDLLEVNLAVYFKTEVVLDHHAAEFCCSIGFRSGFVLEVEEVTFVVEESAIKLFLLIKKINQKATKNNKRRNQSN